MSQFLFIFFNISPFFVDQCESDKEISKQASQRLENRHADQSSWSKKDVSSVPLDLSNNNNTNNQGNYDKSVYNRVFGDPDQLGNDGDGEQNTAGIENISANGEELGVENYQNENSPKSKHVQVSRH